MNKSIFISNFLEIKESTIKNAGLGVFTTEYIPMGMIVEQASVQLLHHDMIYARGYEATWLTNYCFAWTTNVMAIAFGFGGLYNHNLEQQNLDYRMIGDPQSIQFIARRPIEEGEELFVRYFARKHESISGHWIDEDPKDAWHKAADEYDLAELQPDARLKGESEIRIEARRKNRMGTLKSMSSLVKKS